MTMRDEAAGQDHLEAICEEAIQRAIEVSMQNCRVCTREDVIRGLRKGDPQFHGYFRYHLAKHLGEAVLSKQVGFKGMYLHGSSQGYDMRQFSDINIIVHSNGSIEDIMDATTGLNIIISKKFERLIDLECKDCFRLLDVTVVDDNDVRSRKGFGSVLSSVFTPPIPVVLREDTGVRR